MYVRYANYCARMKARLGTTASLHFKFLESCCVLLFQKIIQNPKTTLDPEECRNDFQVHGIYESYVYGCLRIVESISRTVVCSLSVRYVVCGRTCVLCISKCVLFVCIVRKVCKCIGSVQTNVRTHICTDLSFAVSSHPKPKDTVFLLC